MPGVLTVSSGFAPSASSVLSSYPMWMNRTSHASALHTHSAPYPTNRVILGNYVPAATWAAAEPSIAVVSASLPSLRPLFARLIWRKSYRPVPAATSKHRNLASWRSPNMHGSGPGSTQGSFNRLQEFSSMDEGPKSAWRQNSVTVLGGRRKGGGAGCDVEEGGSEQDVPLGRIRADTQVVVSFSDRVEWRDDLF